MHSTWCMEDSVVTSYAKARSLLTPSDGPDALSGRLKIKKWHNVMKFREFHKSEITFDD